METEINNKSRSKVKRKEIENFVRYFADKFKLKDKELSIAIIGDRVMRRLNKDYRGIDKPTDILSFEGEDGFLGELIIDMSQLKRQAPMYSKNLDEELLFIICHGLLHLIGLEDEKEKDRLEMIEFGKILVLGFKKVNK